MLTISLLCLFAFFAGLIDAAVGGGGLIQLPALFNLMPNMASTSLLGTNKLASACGTTFAARSFVGKVHIPWLLVLPAAFTEVTGRAHWEILLRARAIENQCYVLAIGQGGVHENRRETHGNSMLIDPWGDVIARREKGAGVVIGELDHARIAEVRTSLPALTHRVL